MTRRKQNTPKRLKSEDGEETVDDGQEESVTSDSANEDQELDMEAEPQSRDMDNTQLNAEPGGEEETNLHEANDKDKSYSNKSVTDTKKDKTNDESENVEKCRNDVNTDKDTGRPNSVCQSEESEKSSSSQSESKTAPNCHSNDSLSKSSNQSLDKKNRTCEKDNSATTESVISGDDNKLIKEHLSSKSEKSSDLSGPSLFSLSGNSDTESPISKLLSMVNNPEKLHRSSSSQSYSLAATSHSKASQLPSKMSYTSAVRASSTSPAHSSLSKTSKPLSGFLPPYTVYSHFQNMYAKMSKYLDHSTEDMFDKRASHSSVVSPKRESSSSLNPSPMSETDQDQPLDLSVKAKGLDLSVKVKSDELKERVKWDINSRKNDKYIPPSENKSDSKMSNESSLKSLEEKFGGSAFKMDKPNKGLKQYVPYMHPMLPMYGGTLYASALFNTHPWMHTEKLPRPDSSPRKTPSSNAHAEGSNSTLNSLPKSNHSNSDTKSSSSSSSKLSPTSLMAKMTERDLFYHKKYTNLKCSCKKEFETLYDLTIHVKESGHTPCSRIAEQHEFPKLVRGQDMWLNHGSEQTKQILRCIRCGESFKTLPDLTVHMMKTKHYANIVGSETSRKIPPRLAFPGDSPDSEVYRCFECNEPFSGMEQFSKHLITSGHHKSPIIIQPSSPATTSPSPDSDALWQTGSPNSKRCRTFSDSSDKDQFGRRPSLSKLMEYRDFRLRYEAALKNSGLFDPDKDDSSLDSFSSEENKIRCETCSEKIEMSKFVEHVRQCVRTTASDYSTPFKKRRLDYDTSEKNEHRRDSSKSEHEHQKEHLVNGRDTPTNPLSTLSHAFSKDSFLQPDDEKPSSNSAIKAMESFIERSFTSGSMFRNSLFGNSLSRSSVQTSGYPVPMSRMNGHSPKSPRTVSPQVSQEQNIYAKYLPPLYMTPSEAEEREQDVSKLKVKSEENSHNNNETSVDSSSEEFSADKKEEEVRNENSEENEKTGLDHINDVPKTEIKREKEDNSSVTNTTSNPSLLSLQQKYLHFPDPDKNNPSKENKSPPSADETDTGSALASLQGLVYGKSFETKHPIDSLQKLMHPVTSPSKQESGQKPINSIAREASPLLVLNAQSEILKSPVSMLTNNNVSAPNSPYNKSERSLSPNVESHNSEPSSPFNSETDARVSKSETNDISSSLISKGLGFPFCPIAYQSLDGYRKETVRDMLKAKDNVDETVRETSLMNKDALKVEQDMFKFKKQGNGKIKKAPYVYLPLDHSAKFNKYYEMANELASKTK